MAWSASAPTVEQWSVIDPDLARAFLSQLEAERRATATHKQRAEIAPVLAFARALEARCAETSGHADRIARASERLARALGLGEAAVERISLAARLHDVGKVGIPDAILRKPGSLDERETEMMRSHSVTGSEMLASVGIHDEVRRIVRAHHERWDGTGYPDGLRGNRIPLGARIVAVADVDDALRSPRPYRTALSRDGAASHIRDQRGRHFDPEVVDLFLARPSAPVRSRSGPGRPRAKELVR